MKKESAIPPATEVKPETQQERKPFEVARSRPMDLRALRQLSSALWVTVQQFFKEECVKGKPMATAVDTANEYNWILSEIDAFYAQARHGIGPVRVYLIAESSGFTKQMEISIKEKDADNHSLSLAK